MAWHAREPLSDAQLDSSRTEVEKATRVEWGRSYEANVKLAQQAAADAVRRLPWMRELIEGGAGNDPALIRHFASIGLRNAHRSRRY